MHFFDICFDTDVNIIVQSLALGGQETSLVVEYIMKVLLYRFLLYFHKLWLIKDLNIIVIKFMKARIDYLMLGFF